MAVMKWLREADSFAITARGDERDHTVEVELRTPQQINEANAKEAHLRSSMACQGQRSMDQALATEAHLRSSMLEGGQKVVDALDEHASKISKSVTQAGDELN